MAFTNATKETAALAVTALGTYISLHTADPGVTGSGEVTGGTPSYARKQTTWTGGAADGSVPGSQVTFDAPAGTYTHVGVWSASTGGTFVAGFALSAPVTLGAQGQVLVTPAINVS